MNANNLFSQLLFGEPSLPPSKAKAWIEIKTKDAIVTDQSDLQHYYLETKYHSKTKSISQIQESMEKKDGEASGIKRFD